MCPLLLDTGLHRLSSDREHVFSDGAQVIHRGLWEKLMWLLQGKCHLRFLSVWLPFTKEGFAICLIE